MIKNGFQQAKRNDLQARPQHGSPINFDESYKLIQEIVHGNITHEEALNKMAGIRKNIKRLADLNEFYPNQVKVINALFMVDEISTGEFERYKLSDDGYILLRSKNDQKESDIVKQKSDNQPDTTNISHLRSEESDKQPDTIGIPDLEREESAEQRIYQQGQGLKILTPCPMLSRLRISLAQLKAENNSEKPKNEIRQQLYSLYRLKKLTNQLYKSLVDII